LDGYCNKTFRWYEAKVVDAKRSTGGGGDVVDRLKVHFKGWNAKFDEWIERGSDRIAPKGSSTALVMEAVRSARQMVPWWQADLLMERAAEKLGSPPEAVAPESREQLAVEVELEDWCIDYSYPNPSLWLISTSGVWYRVAGALCPGGHRGAPSPEYAPHFGRLAEIFHCCAQVALCLLDFLPANPKLGLQTVVDEVTKRSAGDIDEVVILENYKFLAGTRIFFSSLFFRAIQHIY
jgi:hypothetical protein